MIFRLLVVDDEATMRKGIANFINWETIDCEVTATASDGLEAIQILEQTPIDIVITDIKMPEADGLDVARYIYEKKQETKVILLTGYADFAYAQTAIRYNVSAFLLKPANKKALFEAVQEAQKDLIASRKNSTTKKEELAFLRDQLLQELTDQPYTAHFQEQLRELSFHIDYYFIAAFQTSGIGDEISSLKQIIIKEKKQAYCYRYNQLIITIYFQESKKTTVPTELLKNCKAILDLATVFNIPDVTVGISACHQGGSEFGHAVSEAIQTLSLSFYSEGQISVFEEAPNNNVPELTAENSMDLLHFEDCLNNWQFDQAKNILSSIFMKFRSRLTHSSDAKNISSQIYYICARVLLKKNLTAPSSDFLNQIHLASDIFSLEHCVLEIMDASLQMLHGEHSTQNTLIAETVQYIHTHLSEPLPLETLSEQLHVSPSHLSRTFKKVYQESLTEYINKTRIEQAKKYLENTDRMTYEIAELIGYKDATYFSSIFKKYTGFSPTEYRQGFKNSIEKGQS